MNYSSSDDFDKQNFVSISKLKDQNKYLIQQNENLTNQLHEIQNSAISNVLNTNLSNSNQINNEKIYQRQQEIDDLKSRLFISSNKLKEAQESIVNSSISANQNESNKINLLKSQVSNLSQENSNLKKEIQEHLQNIKKLKEQNKINPSCTNIDIDCQKLINSASKLFKHQFQSIQELNNYIDQLIISQTDIFQLSSLTKLNENQNVDQNSNSQCSNSNDSFKKLINQFHKLQKKYLNLRTSKAALEKTNKNLVQTIHDNEVKFQNKISQLTTEIQYLKQELSFSQKNTNSSLLQTIPQDIQNVKGIHEIQDLLFHLLIL